MDVVSTHSIEKPSDLRSYVLGRSNFAAISAVEGLMLADESKARLERTAGLTPQERREETIRAFRNAPERL